MTLRLLSCAALLLMAFGLQAQTQITVTDADLTGTSDVTWTSENEYILDGLVYLEAGGKLTIEPGTVIRGIRNNDISTGDNTSALIITRGAQIIAEGNASEPIIFTAFLDDIDDATDFGPTDRGLWGGVIILGNAPIARPGGEDGIEGIDAMETRARFGGTDADDNSGIFSYVSIRHGGAQLAPDNEINGLTLGGVGSSTNISYVEVFANLDDGIEFFGGTAQVKYASVAFCGDDGFDYDFGWQGKGQFWFALQRPEEGTGRSGEHDGASPDDQAPFSNPTIYNATYIGIGEDASPTGGDAAKGFPVSVLFRDNSGGTYANSLFTDFNGRAIAVEDRNDTNDGDSYARLQAGDLSFSGNVFSGFGAGDDAEDLFVAFNPGDTVITASGASVASFLEGNDNTIVDETGIAGISRTEDGGLDPRLDADSDLLFGGVPSEDNFFNVVTFKGAFGNSVNWLEGWTALSQNGFLGDLVDPAITGQSIMVRDGDLTADSDVTWTSGNTYTLDGLVFLEAGGKLTIQPGTVVQGLGANDVSTGDNTSALIIARGATIEAAGTAEQPIIFTAAGDDLEDDEDFTFEDRGLWGGVIVLGNATIARPGGEDGIEGIDAMEQRARFGGDNDDDDSGTLRYVSIRHGGAQLAPDNEINGLTLGGVGSETEIDYVEVFANLDDGIEWFGGTVNVTHAATAFCGDDAYDYDFGWRGNGQYWFSLQSADVSTGRAGEHDGAKPDDQSPFSQPVIYNATYVGIGADGTPTGGDAAKAVPVAVLFRDNTGGTYANSIFAGFNGRAIAVEDRDNTDDGDAFARLQAGDLTIKNNLFIDFAAGNEASDLFVAFDPSDMIVDATSPNVATIIGGAGNQIFSGDDAEDLFNNYERGDEFDPRPNAFGLASGNGVPAPAPTEDGIAAVNYYGAFEPGNGGGSDANWLGGWTAISESSAVFDFLNGVGQVVEEGFLLDAPVPNPASDLTQINFELPRATQVTITVVDMLGRPVARLSDNFTAGVNQRTLNVSDLPAGNYTVILDAANNRLVQKMIVR